MFLELSKRNVVECGRNNAKCVIFKMSQLQVQAFIFEKNKRGLSENCMTINGKSLSCITGAIFGFCMTIICKLLSCFRNRSPRNRRTKIPIRPRTTAGV